MGTMLVSSGRGEEAVGGIVRFVESVESDGAVRRVTTSEVVWENAGKTDRRQESKKRAPQLGGLFLKRGTYFFRSAKQVRLQLCNCKRR